MLLVSLPLFLTGCTTEDDSDNNDADQSASVTEGFDDELREIDDIINDIDQQGDVDTQPLDDLLEEEAED